jgi:hypothetical protein
MRKVSGEQNSIDPGTGKGIGLSSNNYLTVAPGHCP